MKVITSGHEYLLDQLDGTGHEHLLFVQRAGENYPGNSGVHSGTNIQEVLRVLIDRVNYLHKQIPCPQNNAILSDLRHSLWCLEDRAAKRHDLQIPEFLLIGNTIERLPTCFLCGHIYCEHMKENPTWMNQLK